MKNQPTNQTDKAHFAPPSSPPPHFLSIGLSALCAMPCTLLSKQLFLQMLIVIALAHGVWLWYTVSAGASPNLLSDILLLPSHGGFAAPVPHTPH